MEVKDWSTGHMKKQEKCVSGCAVRGGSIVFDTGASPLALSRAFLVSQLLKLLPTSLLLWSQPTASLSAHCYLCYHGAGEVWVHLTIERGGGAYGVSASLAQPCCAFLTHPKLGVQQPPHHTTGFFPLSKPANPCILLAGIRKRSFLSPDCRHWHHADLAPSELRLCPPCQDHACLCTDSSWQAMEYGSAWFTFHFYVVLCSCPGKGWEPALQKAAVVFSEEVCRALNYL